MEREKIFKGSVDTAAEKSMDIFQFEASEVYQHHIPCTHKDFVSVLNGKLEMGNALFLEGKAIRRSSNIITDHYRNHTK